MKRPAWSPYGVESAAASASSKSVYDWRETIGAKLSGAGREGVRYAIREMTEERLLVVDAR